VRPDRLVPGGDALARDVDGRVVFARGALPGELVEVELTETKKDWARGRVARVLEASPDRVVPPCPHRLAGCGGCDWQHVNVAAQLPAKVDVVIEALRRTARMRSPVVVPGGSVAPAGHRTTVRVVGTPDGRPGFRAERSHDTVGVVDEAACLVAHPFIVAILPSLRLTPGLDVTLRTSAATGELTARWDRRAGTVEGLPPRVATGPSAAVHEVVAGHRLRVSAGSFFQSGPDAAELLVDAVRRAAPELATARHVADLYAGVGLFAVATTPRSARLTVVESARTAVEDAIVNLEGRATVVERVEVAAWHPAQDPIDVVVADPARTGLGRPGVAAVARSGAPTLVLVSCDPVALARDAALLAQHGYGHEATEVLDVFPHTHHVEAVTRFTTGGAAPSRGTSSGAAAAPYTRHAT
jgi:23S rRNA (uracil1939-C5)-methyltransferase